MFCRNTVLHVLRVNCLGSLSLMNFIWTIRRPNAQNHRIWARNRDDVADLLAAPQVAHPVCVDVFLLFTGKRMIWLVKEKGQSWNGKYFREVIDSELEPFFSDQRNWVGPVGGTLLWHDNAPGWRAKATQDVLEECKISMFNPAGDKKVPQYSVDVNVAENMRAILMEKNLDDKDITYSAKTAQLITQLEIVLTKLTADKSLLRPLIGSFRKRIQLLRDSKGKRLKHLS